MGASNFDVVRKTINARMIASAKRSPGDWRAQFASMACGTPVIAYPEGSVPEVIDEGTTGFMVRSIDEAGAALGKARMLDRTALRQRFEQLRAAHGKRLCCALSAPGVHCAFPAAYQLASRASRTADRGWRALARDRPRIRCPATELLATDNSSPRVLESVSLPKSPAALPRRIEVQ